MRYKFMIEAVELMTNFLDVIHKKCSIFIGNIIYTKSLILNVCHAKGPQCV